MGFFGLSRPQHKSPDAGDRLRAVHAGELRAAQLGELARQDPDPRVRVAAAERIADEAILTGLLGSADAAVQQAARNGLARHAVRLLKDGAHPQVAPLLGTVGDAGPLVDIALTAKDPAVRADALAKALAHPELGEGALERLAVQDPVGTAGVQVVARIDRPGTLKDIARKAKAEGVRSAAQAKLEAIAATAPKPGAAAVQRRRAKVLPPLVDRALRVAAFADPELAVDELAATEAAWAEAVAADQEIPLDAAGTALAERFTRCVGEVKARLEQVRAARAAERQGRAAFLASLDSRDPLPTDTDQGVTASLRGDLETAWAALGRDLPEGEHQDFQRRFQDAVVRLFPNAPPPAPAAPVDPADQLPAGDREKLEALSSEAEQLVGQGREAKFRFQELHKQWSFLSHGLPPDHALKQRFLIAYAGWKDHRRQVREQRQENASANRAALDLLLKEAERLAEASSTLAGAPQEVLHAHATALKGLQSRWREVGKVPPEDFRPRVERFHAILDQAWAPVAEVREAEQWERLAHLGHAEELIQQVEALAVLEDLAKVANGVKQAHQQWKALGSLPRDKGQEAWTRFKTACDTQFERCRPYFAEQDAQRARNLEAKQALIRELEQAIEGDPPGLKGSPAWIQVRQEQHEQVKILTERWKAVGAVPREQEDAIWSAWRAVMDRYWAAHREEMSERDAERKQNADLKRALIAKAEDLAKAAEAGVANPSYARPPERTLDAMKVLQAEWKAIGHVPRDDMEPLWQAWKGAQDRIYATLKDFFDEQEKERDANAARKEVLIQEAEDLASNENPQWFKEDIRELQRKWREIGHVPRNRMDDLNDRFKRACDIVYKT